MPNATFPILFYEIGYLPPSNGMISKNSQMDGYCEGLLIIGHVYLSVSLFAWYRMAE
jgi:hypothetical protein